MPTINASDTLATVGAFVPPGVMMQYGGATAPTGWLLCDGSAVSRSTYAYLYTAIGTAWGYGDNSTTFNLPDMRGRFPRGRDGGIGNDPDRASRTAANTGGNTGDNVGSVQGDVFQGHNHYVYYGSGSGSSLGLGAGGSYGTGILGSGYALTGEPLNDNSISGTSGAPRYSTETRGKNANVNYIIKI